MLTLSFIFITGYHNIIIIIVTLSDPYFTQKYSLALEIAEAPICSTETLKSNFEYGQMLKLGS